MNSDTAEMSIVDAGSELAAPFERAGSDRGWARPAPRWWGELRADRARMIAIRDSWRALWASRLLVWFAGVGTVLALSLIHI